MDAGINGEQFKRDWEKGKAGYGNIDMTLLGEAIIGTVIMVIGLIILLVWII